MWLRTHAFLLVLAGLAVASCDEGTPISPTPTPSDGAPMPVTMTIGGSLSLHHPGDTAQLNATVKFSDNTSRDVTVDASWSASGAVAIVSPGLIKATRYGDGSFTASYLSVSAGRLMRVQDPGAFLIDGLVSAAGTFFPGLAQARVECSSDSGTYTTMTSDSGWYFLPASGETTIRAERVGFVTQIKQVTVEHDLSVDFELQPVETADLSGAHKLTVTVSRPAPYRRK